jgi:cell fate regulator YaaT (PSP1 superfamily)
MSDNTPPATPGDDANNVRPADAEAMAGKPDSAKASEGNDAPANTPPKSDDASGNDLLGMMREKLAETPADKPADASAPTKKPAPDADNFFAAIREAAKDVEVPAKTPAADDDPLALGKLAVKPVETPPASVEEPAEKREKKERSGESKKSEGKDRGGRESRNGDRGSRRGRKRSGEDRRGRKRASKDRQDPVETPQDTPATDDWTDIGGANESMSADDAVLSGAIFEQAAAKPKRHFINVEPGEPLDMPTPDRKIQSSLTKSFARLGPAVVIRYGEMRQTGLFEHSLEVPPVPGTVVVIRSERGVELGKVLTRVAEPSKAEAVEVDAPVDPPETTEVDSDQPSQAETPATEASPDAIGRMEDPGCGGGCGGHGEEGGCGGGCGGGSKSRAYGWIDRDQLIDYLATNGDGFPFNRSGRVLRVANTQDKADDKTLRDHVPGQLKFCRDRIRELKLAMRVVSVENLLGGERVIFYFTSEDRVDFRDLVKRLTTEFKTRVELRQVGARDEARLKGDYERCGQRCCCQEYIKNLQPVSMRMAKLQKATLDPTKISGRCSRLMCCLRYEDACYSELKKNLPHKSTWVRTETMIGKVIGSDVLSQMVKVRLADGSPEAFAIEEIIERNCDEPTLEERSNARRSGRDAPRDRSQMPRLRDTATPTPTPAKEPTPASETPTPTGAKPASAGGEDATKESSEGAPRKRRRRGGRRRRKGRGDGAAGGQNNTPDNASNNSGGSAPKPDGGGEG